MALGLFKPKAASSFNTIKLESLLHDPVGFPDSYLPSVRVVDGIPYIHTIAKGREVDNSVAFYKWIFIDTKNMTATLGSDSEYARIPDRGLIVRICQRSILPYHENFVINYCEDINNLRIVSIAKDSRNEYVNKRTGAYRSFPMGDELLPEELRQEIYSYPEQFFNMFLKDAIPLDLYYVKGRNKSNHMSDYDDYRPTGMNIGSYPRDRVMHQSMNNPNYSSGRLSTSQMQQKINSQIQNMNQTYGTRNNNSSNNKPNGIESTGVHYNIF